MHFTIEPLRARRRHVIIGAALASTATTLWIYGAAQLSAPHAMPLHVTCGVVIPFGAAYVTAMLIEWRAARDDVRVKREAEPERELALAGTAPNPTGEVDRG